MIKEKVLRKEIWKDKIEKILNINIKCFILLFLCIFLIGCDRVSLTKKDFIEKMERKKISVTDISNNDYSASLAITKHYQIYYYEFSDATVADKMMKKEIKQFKSSTSRVSRKTGNNYDKYEIINKNVYNVFSRINNTYVFISAMDEYRDDVSKALRYMGY